MAENIYVKSHYLRKLCVIKTNKANDKKQSYHLKNIMSKR